MKLLKRITRRNFFTKALYALFTLQIVYLFVKLFDPNKSHSEYKPLFEAGDVVLFKNGRVYTFGSRSFFLHRLNDGGFLAVSSKCTHLGCTVQFNMQNDRFECPCHASAFTINGEVLSAPATRPLDFFNVKIMSNKVFVDVNEPVRRDKFLKSQITYV